MEYFKLSNNMLIPKVGLGTNTFSKVDNVMTAEISNDLTDYLTAINNGYRLFDTAISYRNEAPLGAAIRSSGIKREEFYVVSKIPAGDEYTLNKEVIINAVESSLAAIDLGYIDLYLIHKPIEDKKKLLEVWKVLIAFYNTGLLKAIGVSNFSVEQVNFLIENSDVPPMVNQIKINSTNWNIPLINDLLKINVLPQAYSPIKGLSNKAIELFTEIGRSYNKTWAQVILRYLIEINVNVIPKSHNKERQFQNINIFDFKLTKEDQTKISNLIKEEMA